MTDLAIPRTRWLTDLRRRYFMDAFLEFAVLAQNTTVQMSTLRSQHVIKEYQQLPMCAPNISDNRANRASCLLNGQRIKGIALYRHISPLSASLFLFYLLLSILVCPLVVCPKIRSIQRHNGLHGAIPEEGAFEKAETM